jgi:hypothetical protein
MRQLGCKRAGNIMLYRLDRIRTLRHNCEEWLTLPPQIF